ncbi:MAG: hypothetical protein ACPGFC_08980 [Paracoccaceae bacterium]
MSFTPAQVALLDQNSDMIEARRLFEIAFTSGVQRYAESDLPVTTLDGRTWEAAAQWITAAPVTSGDPVQVEAAVYRVGGLTPELVHDALHDRAQWYMAPIRQYLQLLHLGASVGPPISLHRGAIHEITVHTTPTEQYLDVRAETAFASRNIAPLGKYTDRDQRQRSAGDLGCAFVPTLTFKRITGWLRA